MAKAINAQITLEPLSATAHPAIGLWCGRAGYDGSDAFFFKQDNEESGHMLKSNSFILYGSDDLFKCLYALTFFAVVPFLSILNHKRDHLFLCKRKHILDLMYRHCKHPKVVLKLRLRQPCSSIIRYCVIHLSIPNIGDISPILQRIRRLHIKRNDLMKQENALTHFANEMMVGDNGFVDTANSRFILNG
jgi:hypothetical protein